MLTKVRDKNGDYEVYNGTTHVGYVFRTQRLTAKVGVTDWLPSFFGQVKPLPHCDTLKEAMSMIEREVTQLQLHRDGRGDVVVYLAGAKVGKILWKLRGYEIDWYPMICSGDTYTSFAVCDSLKEAVQSIERKLS